MNAQQRLLKVFYRAQTDRGKMKYNLWTHNMLHMLDVSLVEDSLSDNFNGENDMFVCRFRNQRAGLMAGKPVLVFPICYDSLEQTRKDCAMVKSIQHENVIKIFGLTKFNNYYYYVVTESVSYTLFYALFADDSHDPVLECADNDRLMSISKQIIQGLAYIATYFPTVFVKISTRRIMLTTDFRVKIAGVHYYEPVKHDAMYSKPTTNQQADLLPSPDIYAIGIVLVEIWTRVNAERWHEYSDAAKSKRLAKIPDNIAKCIVMCLETEQISYDDLIKVFEVSQQKN